MLTKAFHELEIAKQSISVHNIAIPSEIYNEDDADQAVSSISNWLCAVTDGFTIIQALSDLMLWLEEVEQQLKILIPNSDASILKLEKVNECLNVSICCTVPLKCTVVLQECKRLKKSLII